MSLLNETDAQYLDDTRTLHIADSSGNTPEAVVEFAEGMAQTDGLTVDEELTAGDEFASMVDELSEFEEADEDEDDSDGPDEDEDGDISGWSEDDTDAEYIPC